MSLDSEKFWKLWKTIGKRMSICVNICKSKIMHAPIKVGVYMYVTYVNCWPLVVKNDSVNVKGDLKPQKSKELIAVSYNFLKEAYSQLEIEHG